MKVLQLIVLLFSVFVITQAEKETEKRQVHASSRDNETTALASATTQSPCALVAKLLTAQSGTTGTVGYSDSNTNYATRLATLYALLGALSTGQFGANAAVQNYAVPASYQAVSYESGVAPGSYSNAPVYSGVSTPVNSGSAATASSTISNNQKSQETYTAPGSAAIKTLVFPGTSKPSSLIYSATPTGSNLLRVAGYSSSVPADTTATNYPSATVAVAGDSSAIKAVPSGYPSVPVSTHATSYGSPALPHTSSGFNTGYSSGGARYSTETFGYNSPPLSAPYSSFVQTGPTHAAAKAYFPAEQLPSSSAGYYSASSRYSSTPASASGLLNSASRSFSGASGHASAYTSPTLASSEAGLMRPATAYSMPSSPIAGGQVGLNNFKIENEAQGNFRSYDAAPATSSNAAEDVIPVPLCPKNYLFSCQSQIQPVPCAQQSASNAY